MWTRGVTNGAADQPFRRQWARQPRGWGSSLKQRTRRGQKCSVSLNDTQVGIEGRREELRQGQWNTS